MDDFKKQLVVSPNIINQGIYENELSRYDSIFKNPATIIYTSQISACIKAEIEHHFPGTDFLIECRVKSRPSTTKKLNSDLENANNLGNLLQSPVLYDLLGMTIVIYDIPSNSNLLENERIKHYMDMQKNIKKEKTLFSKYKNNSLKKVRELMSDGGYTPENLNDLNKIVKKISGIGIRACKNNVEIAQKECCVELAKELEILIKDRLNSGQSYDKIVSDLQDEYKDYFSFTCEELDSNDLHDGKGYLLINSPNNKTLKLVVDSLAPIETEEDVKNFPMPHNLKIMEYVDNIREFKVAEKQINDISQKTTNNITVFKNKCPFFDETLYKLYIDLDKLFPIVENANRINLEFAKDECNSKASNDILNYLVNDSELLTKKMGLTSIPSRRKHINKTNGYITEHSSVSSSLLSNYILEILARSGHRNEIAKTGSAAHSSRETKKRSLPEIPKNKKFSSSAIQEQRDITPVFLVVNSTSDNYLTSVPGFLVSHLTYFINEFEPRDKHGHPLEEKDYFYTEGDSTNLYPNKVDQFLGTNLYNEDSSFQDQHTIIAKYIKDYNHSEEAKKFNQFLKDYYSKNPVEEKAQDSEKIDDSSELEQ